MTKMKPLALAAAGAVALAALTGTGTFATAAPSAGAPIQARQANFKEMGKAVKTIKDGLGSGADKATMVAAAKTIAADARKQAKLFPAGTGPSSGVKTDALPAIWTDRANFDAGMQKLITEADKLVAAAGTGNSDAIGAQFKAVGGACGSCHRQFRAQD